MTLAEQAEALLNEALAVDAVRRDAAAAKRRSEVIAELLQLGQDVQAPAAFIRRCRETGIAPQAIGPTVTVAAQGVQEHLRRLSAEADGGPGLNEVALTEARRSLVSLAQRLKELAQFAWLRYCDDHLPRGQGTSLLVLKAVLGDSSDVVELERLDQLLEAYRDNPPLLRPQDVDTFLAKLRRRHELWTQLDVGDLPEDVQRFLMTVPNGAPLPLLTQQVVDWLASKGLLGRYRVVMEES